MRFKASDLDLEGTDNWVAMCDIVSGNEAGYFSIKMDPKTNEAILMLDKVCIVFPTEKANHKSHFFMISNVLSLFRLLSLQFLRIF